MSLMTWGLRTCQGTAKMGRKQSRVRNRKWGREPKSEKKKTPYMCVFKNILVKDTFYLKQHSSRIKGGKN